MRKKNIILAALILLGSLAVADTLPPGIVKLKGATDGTPIGNVGSSLNVNVTSGSGISATVNQGAPGPSVSPWPVIIPTPLPVVVGNFPAPVATQSVSVVNFPSTQNVDVVNTPTVSVNNFPAPVPTQAVSGSVNVLNFPSTFGVTQSTSPWVTSRNWNLSSGSDSVTSFQGTSPWVTSGNLGRTWTLNSGTDSVTITGSISATNPSVGSNGSTAPAMSTQAGGQNGANLEPLQLDGSNNLKTVVENFPATQPISAVSLPLPTGAATNSELTTINSTLGSPFQAGGSIGNTSFGASQSGIWSVTAVQPSGVNLHVDVDNFPTPTYTQAVSGTVTANQGTSPWVVGQSSGANLHVDVDSAPTTAVTGTFFQATQPVSAVSLPLPTGAATNSELVTINSTLGSPFQAGGSIGNSSFGISGTLPAFASTPTVNSAQSGAWSVGVNNFPATQPVSAVSLPLPTGAATSANQTSQITQETTTATNTTSILANQTNGTQKTQVTSIPSDSLPATQNITTQDLVSTTTAGANSQNFITGTPTAGSAASFSVSSETSVEVQVTGTWTGTLQTEVSMDGGTTWFTRGIKQTGSPYNASSFTGNFEGGSNFGGMTNYRVRAVAAMTGTAVVRINASVNPAAIIVSNPLTLRDATTQTVSDTIKAASTASVATDTSLVVAMSPNSSLPTGSNAIGSVTANAGTNLNTSLLALQSGMNQNLDTAGSGTITSSGGSVTMTSNGSAQCTAVVSGTWSAILLAEGVTNGVAGGAVELYGSTGAPLGAVISANTTIVIPAGGYSAVKILPFTFTSGTVTINWECGSGFQALGIPALVTNTNALNYAQASTTSGQTTNLSGAAANSAVQAFTAGKTYPLQTDLRGAQLTTPLDGMRQTYTAQASITPATTATDIFTIGGSATKTIRVLGFEIWGSETTAASRSIVLLSRSSGNLGGSASSPGVVAYDSNNAASTAQLSAYSVNPGTLGTLVGNIRFTIQNIGPGTTTDPETLLRWDFGSNPGQALVLRGTSQYLAVNLNGVTWTGGNISVTVTWTEE